MYDKKHIQFSTSRSYIYQWTLSVNNFKTIPNPLNQRTFTARSLGTLALLLFIFLKVQRDA